MLEGLRLLEKPCNTVLITSDKSYNNVEWVWGYRETDALGGPDPYSASKGAAELLIRSHIKSFYPIEKIPFIASYESSPKMYKDLNNVRLRFICKFLNINYD